MMKNVMRIVGILALSSLVFACDSRSENAREDRLEKSADAAEDTADRVRDAGEARADRIEERDPGLDNDATDRAAEEARKRAEREADRLEDEADRLRDQK